MPTSSQEPRGTGLSSSLVTDFRAILNSLEQEKATRPADPSDTPVAGDGPVPGTPLRAPLASAAARPSRPAGLGEAASPRSLGEVRERIAALGDVSDILSKRASAGPAAKSPPGGGAAADAGLARRRGFGTAQRAPGEADARRKRGASTDVITWQRLGVLALFMAVVGGGAMLLQSLAAREEAKVAPDVIGNAAVASVAPSTPMPVATAVASVAPAAPVRDVAEGSTPTPTASSALAASLPPVLRDAAPPFDATSEPVAVTAFAAPTPAPVVEPAAAAETAPPAAEPAAVSLPKDAPLPPPRAPERQVAAASPAAPAEAAESSEATGEGMDEGEAHAGFGGDPVGTVVTRRPVTMRAAPKKGAAAIGNLPAGQKVDLVVCHQWCEVIVEGKRGFIYKSFVDPSSVSNAESAKESAAAE